MQKTSDSSVKRPASGRLAVDSKVTPPAVAISPGESASLHVLVVDDEPMVCELVERILTDAGHRVHATIDPHEAIGAVMTESYDLLITDRSMPLMSGEELAAAVKATCPSMRVLLVTGSGSDEVIADNIDGFLTKPFMPDALLSELVEIFESPQRPMSRDRLATLTK